MSEKKYLHGLVNRVPLISDEQIAAMRYIEPICRINTKGNWYRQQRNGAIVDPVSVAFNWNVTTVGEPFWFSDEDEAHIITQHCCAYLFKPNLKEVYAAILLHFGDNWRRVNWFVLDDYWQLPHSCDYFALCRVFSGNGYVTKPGSDNGELIPRELNNALPSG